MKIPEFIYFKNYIPDYWHHYKCWAGHKSYLAEELNQCLNENILRLYESTSNPSTEFCLSCLANLRIEANCMAVQNKIVKMRDDIIVKTRLEKINNARNRINTFCLDDWPYNLESNGFKKAKRKYLKAKGNLSEHGFIPSIVEKKSEEEAGIFEKIIPTHERKIENFKNIVIVLLAILFVIAILIIISKIGLFGFVILVVGIPAALKAAKII
jgi:hypothetical protein